MQWAALVAWLLTAFGGATMLAQWLRHGGASQREGIRARGCSPTPLSPSSAWRSGSLFSSPTRAGSRGLR